MTPAQSMEARKLLKWSRDRLAPRCGMPAERLLQFEIGACLLTGIDDDALKSALEAAGVEFISGNGDGLGVRLRRDR